MQNAWSEYEVSLIVQDYFGMLSKELSGELYSKTAHRNILKNQINRPDGSIERKHQNVSAILIKLGLPFIKGYKPLSNYQQLLEEKVIESLSEEYSFLEERFEKFAAYAPESISNLKVTLVDPPKENIGPKDPTNSNIKRPFKIDYLEREQRNIVLGSKGEELIIAYEEKRLIEIGRPDLASSIEWISRFDDSAGFDILSKNLNGTDKHIEVKTTKLSKQTPIFFTNNEYNFSIKKRETYNLYRIFNFNETPMMFKLNGSFDDFCRKEVLQYKGSF